MPLQTLCPLALPHHCLATSLSIIPNSSVITLLSRHPSWPHHLVVALLSCRPWPCLLIFCGLVFFPSRRLWSGHPAISLPIVATSSIIALLPFPHHLLLLCLLSIAVANPTCCCYCTCQVGLTIACIVVKLHICVIKVGTNTDQSCINRKIHFSAPIHT